MSMETLPRFRHQPVSLPKFHLKRDGQYLHWSAKKLTAARSEAWSGTERQAINCIVKFPTAKGCSLSSVD